MCGGVKVQIQAAVSRICMSSHCGILLLHRQEFNATGFLQGGEGCALRYPVTMTQLKFLFLVEAISVTQLLNLFLGGSQARRDLFKVTLTEMVLRSQASDFR